MSYFIYVPTANVTSNFAQEEFQTFCNIPSNSNVYAPQKIFMAPTFSSQFTFTQFPCIPSQQDFMLPTYQSLPQLQPEPLEMKEPRKRQKNYEKQIESAKKNSESNLINHFFSYFNSRQKSQKTVEACIASLDQKDVKKQKLLHLFFNTIQVINKRRGRMYVNRKILNSLFEPQELLKTIPEIKEKIQKINDITIEQLCEVFRKCCFGFYRTYSIDSILSSKRISCVAKEEHFRKRRKVIQSFFDQE